MYNIIIIIIILLFFSPLQFSYGIDNSPTLLDDVHCPSPGYLTVLQCSYSTSIDSGCSSNSNDVTVHCCEFQYVTSVGITLIIIKIRLFVTISFIYQISLGYGTLVLFKV